MKDIPCLDEVQDQDHLLPVGFLPSSDEDVNHPFNLPTTRIGQELCFKASSAWTKLDSQALNHGIFKICNSHLVVFLLRLNVLHVKKFNHCTTMHFVEIIHSSIYCISYSKQADDMILLVVTNKSP